MKLLLLLLSFFPTLALGCGYNYDTWMDGRCFRMSFRYSLYQSEAVSMCEEDGTRLPSIKNAQENEDIFKVLRQYSDYELYSFWLGLSCTGDKFVWADGSEATYTNFVEDVKCTSSNAGRFYYVDNKGMWHETESGNIYDVNNGVCEAAQRSASPCDAFDLFKSGESYGTCYRVHSTADTWKMADYTCKDELAFLSVIHDKKFNDFISQTAVSNGLLDGVHIGLEKEDSGNYTWTDGTDFDYVNFPSGFPNEVYGSCAAMGTEFLPGQWMNVECYSTRLPYFCTKPAFYATNPQPAGCPAKSQYAPGDVMYSPSYPEAPGVSECEYLLVEPNVNKFSKVEITFLKANKCCDVLTIYNGVSGDILATMTGYNPKPLTALADSNVIRLHWKSSSGAHVRGFQAKMISV